MKTKLLLLFLLWSGIVFGQESFKKKYKICHDKIKLKGEEFIFLQKDTLIYYTELPEEERKILQIGGKYIITNEIIINNKQTKVSKEVIVDQDFLNTLKLHQPKNIVLKKSISGFVSFENDKVYINPYLKKDSTGKFRSEDILYYKLKNRQSIRLFFSEFNVSALILPIKYRFKGKDGLQEDFSTAINGNVFFAYSIGKTSFFHREKVGNKSNTWKFSGGLLFGTSTVTLNSANTSKALIPIEEDKDIIKGLGSIGIGATYSFNKINFGAFYGYDYAIGESASRWNYNKKPWLGIAIGYSILNF